MPFISLCMIVKNEDKVLARCLDSVKTFVDEIIIVDTGSTDLTVEIARKYTDKVFHYNWTNDFSAARNESIKHATGDWILVLDADEYLQSSNFDPIKQLLKQHDDRMPCGFIVQVMNFNGSGYDETNMIESTAARLFRNNRSIRFAEPIHEQLYAENGPISYSSLPLVVFHTGYTDQTVKDKDKSNRNLSILEAINTADKRNDPYYCFVLGNEYSNAQRSDDAMNMYRQALKKSKPSHPWYFHLLDKSIPLEIRSGHYSKAFQLIQDAIRLRPDCTDFRCLKGILFETLGLWNAAEEELLKCIEIAEQCERSGKPYWIVQPTYGRIVPHLMIAELKLKRHDVAGTVQHWIKALQLQPKNYAVLQRLVDLLLQYEPYEQVQSIIEKLYPIEQPVNLLLLHKIALNVGSVELTKLYDDAIARLNITLDAEDSVTHSALINPTLAPAIDGTAGQIADSTAIALSLLHQDVRYLQIATDIETSASIAEQLSSALAGGEWDRALLGRNDELLAQILQWLYRYGYSDTYYALLQTTATAQTLNRMADWYYERHSINQALEIYSILLDNEALQAPGYLNVAQWNWNNGDIDDSVICFKESFERQPSEAVIGRLYEIPGINVYRDFLPVYAEKFPDIYKCTFLQ